ncbi:hypothetical protein D3C73_1593670 [compost metagenome]
MDNGQRQQLFRVQQPRIRQADRGTAERDGSNGAPGALQEAGAEACGGRIRHHANLLRRYPALYPELRQGLLLPDVWTGL